MYCFGSEGYYEFYAQTNQIIFGSSHIGKYNADNYKSFDNRKVRRKLHFDENALHSTEYVSESQATRAAVFYEFLNE